MEAGHVEHHGQFLPSANESTAPQLADKPLMNLQAGIAIGLTLLIVWSGDARGQAVDPVDHQINSEPALTNRTAEIESIQADTSRRAALRRLVHRFDFDDPDQSPYVLPRHFFRILTRDGGPPGFPDFGSIAIHSDESTSGESSLRFELEGGSMAATLPPGIINVLPLCDYVLTANVRTRGLRHARVCMVATLHDDRGNAIASSTRTTQPLLTADQWVQVAIAIPGRFPDAASLVLQMQLLQPRQYSGADIDHNRPVLDDVRGTAWFDDVSLWQMPHAELRTSAPGNVVRPDDPHRLELELRDLSSSPLVADLRVLDLDGRAVFEHRFQAATGQQRQSIDLPPLAYGWYQAMLVLHDDRSRIAEHVLPFALVPRAESGDVGRDNPFGVAIERCSSHAVSSIPELMRRCGMGVVIVPVWTAHDRGELSTTYMALRDAINGMLDDRMSITLGLLAVPPPLHRSLAIPSGSMIELALRDPESWRKPVEQMLLGIDQTVASWLIGPISAPQWNEDHPDLDQVSANVSSAISRLVPQPQFQLARLIEQLEPGSTQGARSLILVPHEMQPAFILDELREHQVESVEGSIVLEVPSAAMYQPRDRVIDLMLRGLHAWRAGARAILIRQPWRALDSHLVDGGETTLAQESIGSAQLVPDAILPAWRTLADRLRGRRFLTELQLADGVRCWVVSAQKDSANTAQGMLIAWNEHAPRDRAIIAMPLAAHDVEVIDGFGNRQLVPRLDGRHTIALTDAPVFIEGVDLEPAIFRARLGLDPPFVPSMHRVHERMILLHNPWSTPISGSIRLHAPEGWTISPGNSEFAIGPGKELELPVSIVLDRSVTSGRKTILADLAVQADRDHAFSVPIEVEVGLEDFAVTTVWNMAPNLQSRALDLIITQVVTNRSQRLLTLDVYVVGEGMSLRRRTIAELAPGQTATRTFRIDGGAALMAGKLLRIGVAERGGIARLNQVIDIPALGPAALANQPDQ